jgi:hypothetical protein
MSESALTVHEANVARTIGEWAGRLHIDSGVRREEKARSAAVNFADDIAAIAMWLLPKSAKFRGLAGKTAADYVRLYG